MMPTSLRENKKKPKTSRFSLPCTYIDGLEKAKKVIIDSHVDKSERLWNSMIDFVSI
jgi:hypothetical protein